MLDLNKPETRTKETINIEFSGFFKRFHFYIDPLAETYFYFSKRDLLNRDVIQSNHQYDFHKHYYGPYSKELNKITKGLIRNNKILKREKSTPFGNTIHLYKLNHNCEKYCFTNRINETINRFGDLSIVSLLDLIYNNYPEYTENQYSFQKFRYTLINML